MFKINRLVSFALFVVTLSVTAFSQAPPPKSGLINTAAFYDEKAGITKLVSAEKELNTKFAKDIKDLQDGAAKLAAIVAELGKTPVTAANQAALQLKKEEGDALQRRLGYRKADVEASINKEREKLIAPISFDIGKAISEFGKKNGYGSIFDASKLAETGVLLFVGDSSDITKDFIAFYNARAASVPIAK